MSISLTLKECKSNVGRKAKRGGVRQPRQFSLDVRTIETLDDMRANNSELFESLFHRYEPFLDAWAKLGYEHFQEDEEI